MDTCPHSMQTIYRWLQIQGDRRLRQMELMVGYSASNKFKESNLVSAESSDADSWINIDDEEDPRGRVGVQWPWERDDSESKQ